MPIYLCPLFNIKEEAEYSKLVGKSSDDDLTSFKQSGIVGRKEKTKIRSPSARPFYLQCISK